ncbi:hypothetical protein FRC08_011024 [Ceratobasidium sp. 394]|nr:hypothetical protein FRC08_011024 [Ceratobasidium sp. 394]
MPAGKAAGGGRTSRKGTGGKAPRVNLPTPLDSDDEGSPAGACAAGQPKPTTESQAPVDVNSIRPVEKIDEEKVTE